MTVCTQVSLYCSDNLFGVLDPGDNDVTVQLNISTLGRILKVTQFHPVVRIVCDGGRPVRLSTNIGDAGSHIDIYIQPEQSATL